MRQYEIAVILNITLIISEPNPVIEVTVRNRTTTSVTLSWGRPVDHKPEYTYKVVPSGNLSIMMTADELITVTHLNPGTGYTFSVITLAADNTAAEPVNVSSTTGKGRFTWNLC